jgi:hypothetical protein
VSLLRSLLFALSVLALAAPHADAAVLYGATASGSAGQLYKLDLATGSQLESIGPLNDSNGVNYPITGLAFHPATRVLYGSTGNNPAETAGLLVTINPATALVTIVGPYNAGPTNSSGTPATMADIGFNAAGNLYGVASIGGPQLYSINTATAQATVIGNSGLTSTTGGGIAINDTGVIYGTPTSSRFGTYNGVTGAYTDIANPAKPGGSGSYAALEFHPITGALYGLNSASGSPPPTFLAIIDPATGGVTSVGQSVNAIDAIAIIPEPASLALLGIAAAGLCCVRRRK